MRFASTLSYLSLFFASVLSKNVNVDYNCADTPQLCFNTCWATNVVGHPNPLNGGGASSSTSRKDWGYTSGMCRRQNRNWACPDGHGGTLDCKSLDEYPFASSHQGGFAYQQRVVSLRCIPTHDQDVQGGVLSGIGRAPPTDTYTVRFGNVNFVTGNNFPFPANTWCTSNPSTQNDGHQLVPDGQGTLIEDDVAMWVQKRDSNYTSPLQFSEDGNTATVKARLVDGQWVPIPFEA